MESRLAPASKSTAAIERHPVAKATPPAETPAPAPPVATGGAYESTSEWTQLQEAIYYARCTSTPLKADGWREAIREIDPYLRIYYEHLPDWIERGFDLGPPSSFSLPRVTNPSKPQKYETEDRDEVLRYLSSENEAGRLSRLLPLSVVVEALGGPFQTSPVILIPKPPPAVAKRLVRHFSEGDATHDSVNDILRRFPNGKIATNWPSFAEIVRLVRDAPPGTQALVADCKDAFRQIPIRADQRRFLVIKFGELYAIDTCLAMGLVPATDLWGTVIDVLRLFIEKRLGIILRNWVDDLMFLAQPEVLAAWDDLQAEIFRLLAKLGLAMSAPKTRPFSTVFPFTGFEWDLDAKTVVLLRKKQEKYLQRLEDLVIGPIHCDLETIEKIAGFLSHVCYVVPNGRFHMVAIFKFKAQFGDKYNVKHHGSDRVKKELLWWRDLLATKATLGIDLSPTFPLEDIEVISDACPLGIGIVVDGTWDFWACVPGWDAAKEDNIDLAEALGVELALLTLFSRRKDSLRGRRIRAFCDNASVVGGWLKRRNKNFAVNDVLARIEELCRRHGVQLDILYVKSKENKADGVSRGEFPVVEGPRSSREDLFIPTAAYRVISQSSL